VTNGEATSIAAVAERYFAAWNGRDETALDELLAPSFTWTDPLLPSPLDDLEGVHLFLSSSWDGMSDLRFELIGEPAVDHAASRVAQEWRMLATHDGDFVGAPPSGNVVDLLGTDVFTVGEDGRVFEIRAYYDSATVLRQLDLF
jgi:steroid delta-isomerase-like uncharacterized protein